MKFLELLAEGERAVVTSIFGKSKIVEGPASISKLNRIEKFDTIMLTELDRGVFTNELGKAETISGPCVVHIHPRGEFLFDTRVQLAKHEAIVVIDVDGKPKICTGDTEPVVYITKGQTIHEFKWTGSRGDSEHKTPGALRITKLRLQDTQTYVSYNVRTSDNIVAVVSLMISFKYTDVNKLLHNDDPLGAMFNRIMAELVDAVSKLTFDEFKTNTNEHITNVPLLKEKEGVNSLSWFHQYGIEINSVILREWNPVDRSVQSILERAATANANKAVDEAEHERRIRQLSNEEIALDKERVLDEKRAESAKARGVASGMELSALYQTLTKTAGKAVADKAVTLTIASKAQNLSIPSQILFQ